MDVPSTLRTARRRAGLTQAELARRSGTSQTTVSAYENGRKQPTVETLDRLLAATGSRLTVESHHDRSARILGEVLALAEALPTRHEPTLRYPRLPRAA